MSAKPRILVMMAAYNGERWIGEQIDSILAQEGVEVQLRICDDRSTDGTAAVCEAYAAAHPNVRFSENPRNLGVAMNFMQMVYDEELGGFDLYAFSDQDDVWLPGKLARAAAQVRACEESGEARALAGYGVPVLYYSDLQNVDAELQNPHWELRELGYDPVRWRYTPLIRNCASGCTMVFNADFRELLRRRRHEEWPRIHDVWAYLVGQYCGNVVLDCDTALILRRCSGVNAVGAIEKESDVRASKAANALLPSECAPRRTARRLLDDYGDLMAEDDRAVVADFVSYAETPRGRLRWAFSRDRYQRFSLPDGLLRRLKFLLGRY